VLGGKFSALFGFIQKRLGYPENFFVPPTKIPGEAKIKMENNGKRN
jgi:hypothetical protein